MEVQVENIEKQEEPLWVEETKEREPQKIPSTILKQEIKDGLREIRRPAAGLLISGLSAGLDLGFSVLLIALVQTLVKDTLPPIGKELLIALAYSVGFIFVVLGASELFTEHTTLAVFPVLNRDASILDMLRVWGLVLLANLIGGAAIAFVLTRLGPGLGVIEASAFGEMAHRLIDHPWPMILLSGILAGWLMGLLSWLSTASRETISQALMIVLITGTIGFAHLHHAITGSIEVLAGVFAGQGVSLADFGYFLLWTTLGNILGGVIMVALVKYGHVIQEGEPPEEVEVKK